MPEAWHISCTAQQVGVTVHTWRKVNTGSEKEFRLKRRRDMGSEEDHHNANELEGDLDEILVASKKIIACILCGRMLRK